MIRSGCVLKVKPVGFADEQNVRSENRKEARVAQRQGVRVTETGKIRGGGRPPGH